jgi:hypothetical protein
VKGTWRQKPPAATYLTTLLLVCLSAAAVPSGSLLLAVLAAEAVLIGWLLYCSFIPLAQLIARLARPDQKAGVYLLEISHPWKEKNM